MQASGRYKKGANAERELAKIFIGRGFAVARSAKSGGRISIPDIIAIKGGKILAFECKTWERKPKLKTEEFNEISDWCTKAGAHGFLAWRKRGKWTFLHIDNLKIKDIAKDGSKLEDIINFTWS